MDNLEAAKQYFIAGAMADPRAFTLDHAVEIGWEAFINTLDTMWEGLIDGVRAEVWNEGHTAGWDDAVSGEPAFNPYEPWDSATGEDD